MKKKFDFFLKLMANSNEIVDDDRLSELVENCGCEESGELTEFELDHIAAAGKSDYERFVNKLRK